MTEPTFKLNWWVPSTSDGLKIGRTEFRAATSGLHVLFGPNNSGKSRILRLLRQADATLELPWEAILPYGGAVLREAAQYVKNFTQYPLLFDVHRSNLALSLSQETRERVEQLRHQMGARVSEVLLEIDGAIPNVRERIEKLQPALYIRAHRYLETTAPINNQDGDPDNPQEMVRVLSRWQNHQDPDRRDRFDRVQRAFNAISGTSFALRQSDKWTVHISEDGAVGERALDECGDGLRDLLGLIYGLRNLWLMRSLSMSPASDCTREHREPC